MSSQDPGEKGMFLPLCILQALNKSCDEEEHLVNRLLVETGKYSRGGKPEGGGKLLYYLTVWESSLGRQREAALMGKLPYYRAPVTAAYITFQAKIIETTLEAPDMTRSILLGGHRPSRCSTSLQAPAHQSRHLKRQRDKKNISCFGKPWVQDLEARGSPVDGFKRTCHCVSPDSTVS